MAKSLLKRTSTQILLLVISTIGTVFVIFGFIRVVHHTHEQRVLREWSAAYQESEKLPPSIGRAEDALARYKRINLGYTSKDFKQAASDYIAALQGSIDALKAGRDTASYDAPMAAARTKMIDIAER